MFHVQGCNYLPNLLHFRAELIWELGKIRARGSAPPKITPMMSTTSNRLSSVCIPLLCYFVPFYSKLTNTYCCVTRSWGLLWSTVMNIIRHTSYENIIMHSAIALIGDSFITMKYRIKTGVPVKRVWLSTGQKKMTINAYHHGIVVP